MNPAGPGAPLSVCGFLLSLIQEGASLVSEILFFLFVVEVSQSKDGFPFSSCVGKMFFISFVQSPGIPGKGVPGQTSVGCPTGLHARSLSICGEPLC